MGPRRGQKEEEFDGFVRDAEMRLSRAFAAAYGPDLGAEATAEAIAYAWEHWKRLREMENPIGYMYRVGQTRVRRFRFRRPPIAPVPDSGVDAWVEPRLLAAIESLSRNQRVAVVLVGAYGWTQREVAELLDVSRTTVQKHVERGMAKLRASMEVSSRV